MTPLKQSTAINLVMGPFVDETDGRTAETALTIAQADVRLSKGNAAYAQKNDATSATHMENGEYSVPLNATDTNTLGRLKVLVNEAGALPVWLECWVYQANVYDSLFGGTDFLETSGLAQEFSISGATLTLLKRDDTTTQRTKTIGTTPGADPVTSIS